VHQRPEPGELDQRAVGTEIALQHRDPTVGAIGALATRTTAPSGGAASP
jgi:hypothetical protein